MAKIYKKEDLIPKLVKTAEICFKKKKLSINTSVKNLLEWGSLNHIKLMVMLQKKFGVKFQLDEIVEIEDLKEWLKLLKKKLKIK